VVEAAVQMRMFLLTSRPQKKMNRIMVSAYLREREGGREAS